MKRKFPVALLKEWGLPWSMDMPDDLRQDEAVDHGRWTEYHHVVFRAPDDDRLWRVGYEVGLTEYQDSRPWDEGDSHVESDGTVEAVEVEAHRVITVTYRIKEN